MSSGANCEYVELRPGEWYYLLEQWDAPKQAFNWREFADVVGPFPSQPDAKDYLLAHNSNPGGAMTYAYSEASPPSERMRELVAQEAVDPLAYPHGRRLGYDYGRYRTPAELAQDEPGLDL